MKKLLTLTVISFAVFTLFSCTGKSKNNTAAQTETKKQEETVMSTAAIESNGMAAKFMKSAEKAKVEAEAQSAEIEGFEQKEPIFESAARHGFKFGTVINPQNLQKKSYTDMVKADFNSLMNHAVHLIISKSTIPPFSAHLPCYSRISLI